MVVTAYWSPNQASVAQIETVTLVGAPIVGNTFSATTNGKTVTYTALATDTTAALFVTGLFNLLNVSSGIAAEFTEITYSNPVAGQIVATAKVPGTPFANVPGTSAGLVFSTGNGYSGSLTTIHTQANQSPSDVIDPQNWLRFTLPAPGVRALPVNGDDVIVANTGVPMLWNLDQLKAVQFNTYSRWQSMTGAIGLPDNNPNGYSEWRPTYFWFVGPQGSVPAGGLQMVLGQGNTGSGPSRERYNVQSQQTTLTVIAAGQAADEYGVRFLGVHTANTFTLLGGVSLGIGMLPGEAANLSSSTVDGDATLGIGDDVTWTAASTLTMYGGSAILLSAPATLALTNGAQVTVTEDQLTWTTITAQGGSTITWLAGGTVTNLTLSTGATMDKSQDGRLLTITNSIIDGDTCSVDDLLNSIVWTNATTVKQQVTSGPFTFTGPRTVKVT